MDFLLSVFKGACETAFLMYAGIFVHELGHAVAAWCHGMRVEAFHVTPWGGYCRYVDDAHSDFVYENPLSRLVIGAAGGAGNFLAALAATLVLCYGAGAWTLEVVSVIAINCMFLLQVVFCTANPHSDGAMVQRAWAELSGMRSAN
jgi:membrane-associated protease RseP (regulator of RpoE activity)